MLIRALYEGSLGSSRKGQRSDQQPSISRSNRGQQESIQLSRLIGRNPSCSSGQLRVGRSALYASLSDAQDFGNDANFLMVYVREARPSDGWKMESTRVGVAVKQPTTLDERKAVAGNSAND